MRLPALCLAILVAACGGDQAATVDAQPDTALVPTLSVTANPTTVAAGGTVALTITTENFLIIAPGRPPKTGEGHYHYYLDDAANYVAAWSPTANVRLPNNAAPGVHMVRLVLVSSDHVEITPLVETTVTFTVQ